MWKPQSLSLKIPFVFKEEAWQILPAKYREYQIALIPRVLETDLNFPNPHSRWENFPFSCTDMTTNQRAVCPLTNMADEFDKCSILSHRLMLGPSGYIAPPGSLFKPYASPTHWLRGSPPPFPPSTPLAQSSISSLTFSVGFPGQRLSWNLVGIPGGT